MDLCCLTKVIKNTACFTDSDWANDTEKRLSVGGHVFTVYGGIVEYHCKKTRQTACSSQEAEWYSACDAAKTAKYIRNLFQQLDLMDSSPIPLMEDNQVCIDFTTKPIGSSQMKHLDLRYHFLKDYLRQGVVKFFKVKSQDNISDIFTKALPIKTFVHLREMMNVNSAPEFLYES